MPIDPELQPHIDEASRLNNLDPDLLRALIMGESGGDPNATSSAGAGGLTQLMPGSAKGIDPYDPVQAIYRGADILNSNLTKAEQLKAGGRDINPVEYALKEYFAGPEGQQWGPKTDAYPGYIASKYQAAPKQPSGVDQRAAAGSSQGPVKTNAIGEQYQQDGEGGWHLVGNPQGIAAVRALTPSSPAYAATRGPGNDVGINISPVTGKPYQDPPLSPADPLNGNGKPYVVPDNFPQERAAQIKTGAGMDGVDQLAAAGQPQPAGDMPPGVMQLAQAGQGGMSDEALLKGFVDGTLPFMQKPAAMPAAAPQAPPAAAQTPTPAPTQPPQSTAAPALDVPGLIDTYNRYRSFPAGLPLAQGALGMLQKMAPEGYVLGQDGTLSLRPGFAQGKEAEAAATAQGKTTNTPVDVRQGAATGFYDANHVFHPAFQNPRLPEGAQLEEGPNGQISTGMVPGSEGAISAASRATHTGQYQAEYSGMPNSQIGAVGGAPPNGSVTGGAQPGGAAQPITSQYGTKLPEITSQFMPQSPAELEKAIPRWDAKTAEWTAAINPARQAEQRLSTIAQAFKMTEPGAFTTQKAELASVLKGLGIDPTLVTNTDPAAVQLALHENILTTLPLLKAATPRPSQVEFTTTMENREHPNIQPAANLQMLAEDIGLVRQAQALPSDWNAAQQHGWRNADSFETAWNSANPLSKIVDQVKQEIGSIKGTEKDQLPAGATQIGTYQGKPVYQLPDGRRQVLH